MTKALVGTAAILLLVLFSLLTWPMYLSWKNEQIVQELQSKVVPFLSDKKIVYFDSSSDCKQISYLARQAATPAGCAYVPNVASEHKGNLPDFTTEDEDIFSQFNSLLSSVSSDEITSVQLEYPISYRAEHASLPQVPLGTAFAIKCSFCRTRYVYAPNYQSLPPNIKGEVIYTSIDKNWFRVDQDWN